MQNDLVSPSLFPSSSPLQASRSSNMQHAHGATICSRPTAASRGALLPWKRGRGENGHVLQQAEDRIGGAGIKFASRCREMSAPESLSPAFSCTPPLLGVRGAKMYLQVKGAESSFFKRSFKHTSSAVGGGASRIPAVTQVPESQVTPPENRMVGSSNLRATFTKSSPPETKEVELKQGTGALAEPLIASRPVGKRGAPRGIGRGRAKNHGRGKSTAAEGRPTKTESSVGTRKKVARGNRGVTVGRRELQKILQSRKR